MTYLLVPITLINSTYKDTVLFLSLTFNLSFGLDDIKKEEKLYSATSALSRVSLPLAGCRPKLTLDSAIDRVSRVLTA